MGVGHGFIGKWVSGVGCGGWGWLVFLFLCCCLSVVHIHPSMAEHNFVFKVVLLGGPAVGSTPIHHVLRIGDWFDARYSLPLLGPHRVCCVASPDYWRVYSLLFGMYPLLSPGLALDSTDTDNNSVYRASSTLLELTIRARHSILMAFEWCWRFGYECISYQWQYQRECEDPWEWLTHRLAQDTSVQDRFRPIPLRYTRGVNAVIVWFGACEARSKMLVMHDRTPTNSMIAFDIRSHGCFLLDSCQDMDQLCHVHRA